MFKLEFKTHSEQYFDPTDEVVTNLRQVIYDIEQRGMNQGIIKAIDSEEVVGSWTFNPKEN